MKKQIISLFIVMVLCCAIISIGTASTGNQNNTSQSGLNNSISVNRYTAAHPDISSVPKGIYGTDTQLSASTTSTNKNAITATTTGDGSDGVAASTSGQYSVGLVGYTYGPGAWGVYANSAQSIGLYASTNVPNGYGIYTPNYIYAKGTKIPNSDVAEYMPVTENVTPGMCPFFPWIQIPSWSLKRRETPAFDDGV